MVLQDLVNELGRRLEYTVTNGRYQGTANAIGFDGLWLSPEGHSVVVEVKTTDVYRISLDTIAGYRSRLSSVGRIAGTSSILIVVGREDTGELEAQVRGSRHAWDIRLISADALIKLVQLKENTEGDETGLKIRSLLTPMEYTRLDKMIDVMFTAAADVGVAAATAEGEAETASDGAVEPGVPPTSTGKEKGVWQFTDRRVLDEKRSQIIAALGRHLDAAFIRKSGAYYWDASHEKTIVLTLSKRHAGASARYWYGYRAQWRDFLVGRGNGHLVLGCVDLPFAFAVPASTLEPFLEGLSTTVRDNEMYWHINIVEPTPGRYAVSLPSRPQPLWLDSCKVALT